MPGPGEHAFTKSNERIDLEKKLDQIEELTVEEKENALKVFETLEDYNSPLMTYAEYERLLEIQRQKEIRLIYGFQSHKQMDHK